MQKPRGGTEQIAFEEPNEVYEIGVESAGSVPEGPCVLGHLPEGPWVLGHRQLG